MNTTFKTATDFRKSLEARLQKIAAESGEDLQRLRRKVAFDRLLARIFSQEIPAFYLKGGYAMELRIAQARATKDIDLTCVRRVKNEGEFIAELMLLELQELARIDLKDYFIYRIGRAQLDLQNAPYGGARYPVSALIDSKVFVSFQLDIGADVIVDSIENIRGVDWLGYCGIPSPTIPIISIEQQFAEKMHAYTLPRDSNSRVKDLIDMILLLKMKDLKPEGFLPALQKVFKARNTHALPDQLMMPPSNWESKFAALAAECGLQQNLKEGFEKIARFYKGP